MRGGRGGGPGGAESGEPGGADPRAAHGSATYRRALIALFCAGLATFAQMYSPQGILPDLARDFGVTAGTSSWAVGATTIGVALGVIPWARASERLGRIATMRLSMSIALVIGLIAPAIPSFSVFLAARFVEGVALAGLPALAVTAIAEIVRPQALGAAVGTYIAGTTIGGLIGRIVAGTVADWAGHTGAGWRLGMAAVAALAAVATVVFLIRIPPAAVRRPAPLPMLAALADNLRNPGVLALVAQAFLLMGGFVAAYNYLAFRLQGEPFGLTLAQVSWLFLAYLAGAVSSRWVWRIARRVPPTGVLLGCIGLMLAGLGLTLLPWLPAVILGLVLFTGGFFGAHSIASGLIDRRAGAGRVLAPPLYNLGYYAGSSLLGWLGGVAFAAGGWGATAAMIAVSALAAAALALLIRPRGAVVSDFGS
ncbi:MFS transporter [Leucobacter luti]|uniref:MFS transporter n=1 Tax=Leucobacter luti TaxID=340320 RepID=UPI003D01ECC4